MSLQSKCVLTGLAALALAIPAWARMLKANWNVSEPTTIGSTQVKAGSYQVLGDDSKKELNILLNGKVIGTVQGDWVKLPKKSNYSAVLATSNKVTQVQFERTDKAFEPR